MSTKKIAEALERAKQEATEQQEWAPSISPWLH
jgi:hypothetical protein